MSDGTRFELPQAFFMRVAMGLALREIDREARAIEFYDLLSSFDFMGSTPTLFNAGTLRPQLSSCFLTTVPDDLDGIFKSIKDNALLSKYAGGLGNDWTRVRGLGAHIKGTNGESQGVVPFLKVANDTAIAVNQGGKRKGAVCAYLETWHIDIEEFLDLRKNTGDDRRRTHDMNTANWVPDLFMQRVEADGDWTLFSPDETPDLHDLYGQAFAERYEAYEAEGRRAARCGCSSSVRAVDLWRRMLTMLFETGHPWITFKDPCNLRSPQQHVRRGALLEPLHRDHAQHLGRRGRGLQPRLGQPAQPRRRRTGSTRRRLKRTVTHRDADARQRHRHQFLHDPGGAPLQPAAPPGRPRPHGLPGRAACAAHCRSRRTRPWRSPTAAWRRSAIYAIAASVDLAAERGRYPSFEGSLWSQGHPADRLRRAARRSARRRLDLDRSTTLDWERLRERVATVGMRNSNVMAIAPTATISNICGVSQSIEPAYQNLYVKSNMSGDFTVVNAYLVRDLKARGLWDEVMVSRPEILRRQRRRRSTACPTT